jgi:hypothetical protein
VPARSLFRISHDLNEQKGGAQFDGGGYADAEPLYKRVLAINEKARGPDRPSVALALNDLRSIHGGRFPVWLR